MIRFRQPKVYEAIDTEIQSETDNPMRFLYQTHYHGAEQQGSEIGEQRFRRVFGTRTMSAVKFFPEVVLETLPDSDHTELCVSDQASIYEAALEDSQK